jgi:hypothetical protein
VTARESLLDPVARAGATARLSRIWAGRPVILGPGVLAGWAKDVPRFRALGCPVLVVSTARGAGDVPGPDDCVVVEVELPAAGMVTDELRALDGFTRTLPPQAVAAIDAFDPGHEGIWVTSPFVTTDEPIDGRPVTGGRPAAYLALEDKMLADGIWDAAEVPRAPYRLVEVGDGAALATATAELAGELGAVWVGDARDGFNGGGNYVRWVRDAGDRADATAFFEPRCDRVRVMPFLEGVPCSIHGFVLPDGTAALRPVEIAVLRDPARRKLVYGGLGTTWDPPPADREQMRAAVRRVGAHLQRAHGYRGAFGIDGVLTADGFRPTELNTRMSAGATTVAEVDRAFFVMLQAALVAAVDTGISAAQVEELVSLMDAHRTGRVVAVADDVRVSHEETYPVAWDGTSFARADAETGNVLSIGATPTGFFATVDPCAALAQGERLATVTAGLLELADREYGSSFGALEPAPDVRS